MELILFTVLLAVALAMDAFAVAVSLGMSGLAKKFADKIKISFVFGAFQSLMFTGGFYALYIIGKAVVPYDRWISGGLLLLLGIKMIWEALFKKTGECPYEVCSEETCKERICSKTGEYRFLTFKLLLFYGTATSVDAFAAGASYILVMKSFAVAALLIGLTTFVLSYLGANSGTAFKRLIGNKADLAGGIILILLSIKAFL